VTVELVVRSAAPGLQPYIRHYTGYAERTSVPTRQREPASTGVVLIFGLGPELRLLDPADPTRLAERFGSFVAGPDDACTMTEHDGEMRGVEVGLTPFAARMIFRVPMHALARHVVTLEDLLGREALRLEERLLDAHGWDARFDLIENALGSRLLAAEPPPPDVEWAWRRLRAASGRVRIADLAGELGCSRKHLAARFREHVGLPPSLVGRLLRFQLALDMLSAPHATIAEVAAACGYYDQAHLDRDFREFAATTPTAWVADVRTPVTSVQDAAAVPS
jgi:AraC-like DNA-binding protein